MRVHYHKSFDDSEKSWIVNDKVELNTPQSNPCKQRKELPDFLSMQGC